MNSRSNPRTAIAFLLSGMVMCSMGAMAAEDEHAAHHPEATQGTPAANTGPAGMAAMQAGADANMKKMQAQMAAFGKTTDPKERAKLLDEHMQTMTATMQSMQKAAGGMKMGEGSMPMQGGGGMGMMPMMQMMMDQMMQHQKAMAPVPAK